MKVEEIARAYDVVAADLKTMAETGDDWRVLGGVNFAVGFLLGGDQAYAAMLVLALAEKHLGAAALTDLKRKVGLAGEIIRLHGDV